MSIRKSFTFQGIISGILLITSILLIYLAEQQLYNLEAVESKKEKLNLGAEELRATSQDLTRLCRLFAATNGQEKYEKEYFHIIDWRSGKIPRPRDVKSKLFINENLSHYDMFKRLGCTEEELKLLNKATELSNNLALLETQAMETIKKGHFVNGPIRMSEGEDYQKFAIRILNDDNYHKTVKTIMKPIDDFLDSLHNRSSMAVNKAQKSANIYFVLTSSFIILSTIAIAIFIIFLNKSVIRPIVKSSTFFEYLAKGNLTKKMEVKGNNEISQMAKSYNETVDGIRNIVQTIKESSSQLLHLGENLATNMNETASAINQISANVEGVKKQMDQENSVFSEAASATEEMLRTINQLNKHIETQSTNVTQSSSAVEEMVANIKSVTQILTKNEDLIRSLQEAALKIKEASANSANLTKEVSAESESLLEAATVIQKIASQTNLLAMNAAIEAAHAGDAGKGFAVVADEIRKLAEESSTQGKTITQVLKTLKLKIDNIAEDALNSETLFNESFEITEGVRKQEDTIMNAMQEQNTGSGEVLTAMMGINTITSEVKSGSEEMMTGSEQIAQEMKNLTQISDEITKSMNEMSAGTTEINNSINNVNDITIQNNESIHELVKQIEKFVLEE